MIDLGVGKNMVQAIKHWCQVAGLIEPTESRGDGYRPTRLGSKIFLDPGYDPYIEDPATLWLIHWQIASNRKHAATCYWLFNLWHSVEFTKSQMLDEIERWIERDEIRPTTPNTLKRDVDTYIRTYVAPTDRKNLVNEDSFSCPLTELSLIQEVDDGYTYQVSRGKHKSLPNSIFLYGLSRYWEESWNTVNSLSIEKITYEPGSPGKIFKLDGEAIAQRLESASKEPNSPFRFEEKNGLKQVYRAKSVAAEYWLEFYYNNGK